MTRKLVGLLVVAVLSMTSASALAQKKSEDCKEQRKRTGKCELIIDGDDLTGDVVKPDDNINLVKPPKPGPSLIRYRVSMVDKMVKNAEDF